MNFRESTEIRGNCKNFKHTKICCSTVSTVSCACIVRGHFGTVVSQILLASNDYITHTKQKFLGNILIIIFPSFPCFRMCVPLPTAAANGPRGLMRGVRLHVYYIHVGQYVHFIGSDRRLWAAGEYMDFWWHLFASLGPVCIIKSSILIRLLLNIWAASRKKVPNVLSRCHTKRRTGVWGRARPSFGMTPTF